MLPLADVEAQVPGLPWDRLQGSGAMLPPPSDARLEWLWTRHLTRLGLGARGGTVHGSRKGSRQAWQQDPVKRRAVEDHGQRLLEQHYRDRGWVVKDVHHGSQLDATATKGDQTLYLEAKGTETDGISVHVSRHEVDFARHHVGQRVLGIVKNIRFRDDGTLDETSGKLEILTWDPDSGELMPTGFEWRPSRTPTQR